MTIERMGDSPRRREDARFVTGQGAYLDDLKFEGVAQAVVLRSPHAHAIVKAIDTRAARGMPGVLAVLTATEAEADGLKPPRPYAGGNIQTGRPVALGSGELCGLGGTHVPFDTATLKRLYPTHAAYVAKVTTASNAAVKAGFLLPADAAQTIDAAKAIGSDLASVIESKAI